MPVFDRLLGRRHTALVLRSLSLFVEGGKPIPLGLALLAEPLPDLLGSPSTRRADTSFEEESTGSKPCEPPA